MIFLILVLRNKLGFSVLVIFLNLYNTERVNTEGINERSVIQKSERIYDSI